MTAPTSDVILDRMMSLHPKVIDLTLGRMARLLPRLGDPQLRLPPVIHVAGTNGKGSTQAMLRAGIEAAGQSAHAYTSPHLARFHERIRVAGEILAEPELAALLAECESANAGEDITFFEITTCAAFLAFARTPADWTLLEVGLGGRWDATNVIGRPKLSIITPVSPDHQQYLGETLVEIADAKAGIIKRGVPCVVGPQPPEAMAVIEAEADARAAPLLVRGQHWMCWAERGRMVFQDETGLLDLPLPNLPGPHQIDNAGAALAALRHLGFDEAACEAAVTRAHWPGRMQRLRHGPLAAAAPRAELWLDGGHNPAGGRAVAATLAAMPARATHLVVGMLNTKDVAGYLAPLAEVADSLHAVSIPGERNTLPADATAEAARAAGFAATISAGVAEAVAEIVAAEPEARILICGSLYLAGHVLRENG
ncbi:bifunctional folylpolyglutamate synthase/dihydrofolate synthase [Frigidibacter sp. ROC022]|uniref:bifunctional folylpolyglutamate synthase/dihydrofolate synthase n=1 Tax=Frigidibacter sp. ROC022 TaxID=2971796 RepID=UPI00215B7594|nr:folylpolyglutamate synthase/dihydrofolate synthase family protein [Frigidibacter sp. ROC022]MCR8726497.1 bifunctional folylpolyglutamate synthase/dihydrofolate synthase [Frigidibacter sp. ROC022]